MKAASTAIGGFILFFLSGLVFLFDAAELLFPDDPYPRWEHILALVTSLLGLVLGALMVYAAFGKTRWVEAIHPLLMLSIIVNLAGYIMRGLALLNDAFANLGCQDNKPPTCQAYSQDDFLRAYIVQIIGSLIGLLAVYGIMRALSRLE